MVARSDYAKLNPEKFKVAVYWMQGRTTAQITEGTGWEHRKIWRFAQHLFDRPRNSMTTRERQVELDALKAVKPSKSRVREDAFIARYAPVMSAKEADPEDVAIDRSTREGRRKARQMEREAARRAELAKQLQEEKERGFATQRGELASALRFLANQKLLADKDEMDGSGSSARRRLEMGMKLQEFFDGTRIGGLKAFDMETASMGASSGPKLSLGAHRIHCGQVLAEIKQMMPHAEYSILESVVDHDRFVWEIAPAGGADRQMMYDIIRFGLDVVAVHQKLMSREVFAVRWNHPLPIVEQKGRGDAAALAEAGKEFFEAARA